jgi:hypothetical protein
MTKSLFCSGLLLVGVSIITAGCVSAAIEPRPICDFNALMAQRQPPGPAAAPVAPSPLTGMPINSVNITDVMITNKVMVQAVNARRNPSGTLEVWARVVNCTDYALQIEGRTHFLDEVQAPIEDVSAWNRVHLAPRSYGVYQESSTKTAGVRHYFVEIREGR